MNTVYFIHQTGPAQFKHIVQSLLESIHYNVVLVSMSSVDVLPHIPLNGLPKLCKLSYAPIRSSVTNQDSKLVDIDSKLIRGESIYIFLQRALAFGYPGPDIIYVHPGWGEALFLSDLFPGVPQVHYCEYYYSSSGFDTSYGIPVSDLTSADKLKPLTKNILNAHSLLHASALVSPTHWQANTYPQQYSQNIEVIHDGIDMDLIYKHCSLASSNPVITSLKQSSRSTIVYVNRAFERIRGSHIFLSSLPHLLDIDPRLNICIVGGDRSQRPYGQTSDDWHNDYITLLDYVKQNPNRIYHFPRLSYSDYHQLLSISSCNIYLSVPFVLSWSLLEMMAISRPIAASSTEPVLEFLSSGCAELFEYNDYMALVSSVINCLLLDQSTSKQRSKLLHSIVSHRASLRDVVIPRHHSLLNRLLHNAK